MKKNKIKYGRKPKKVNKNIVKLLMNQKTIKN